MSFDEFFLKFICPLPSIFISVFPQMEDVWEWLLKYFKVGSVFSFKFFFLSDFRSKLTLKVHTNAVCVGSRFLMLFTWFWRINWYKSKGITCISKASRLWLNLKIWGVLLKNKVIKISDLQMGFVPCLGDLSKDDWILSVWTQTWFDKLAQVHHCLNLCLCSFSLEQWSHFGLCTFFCTCCMIEGDCSKRMPSPLPH